MKIALDGILVVEGKEDASYLSSFITSEIVVLNGFELAEETINYLKGKRVIALLDPDDAGKEIRKKLNSMIDNVFNVEIDINKCNRGKKNGVAECEINHIIDALSPYFDKNDKRQTDEITMFDLYRIGLTNSDKNIRDYVSLKLNLGKCNSKQLLKRLNNNSIDISTVENIIKQYHGNK